MPAAIPVAIAASAVVGAEATKSAANKAANAQTSAATQATDAQRQMFDITQGNLQPYNQAGTNASNLLTQRLPDLTAPIKMDQATLEQTPGYQFNLTQGLKGVQNSAAARGLGTSGAALKGAANYATGLADSTYQNQFNNANINNTNSYNRLLQLAGLGENAAAGVGNAATATGANIGSNLIGAGNAQGGAAIAAGNGLTSAAQSIPNSLLTQQLIGKGIYGNTANSGSYTPYNFDENQSAFQV